MAEFRIGSLVVVDAGCITGIITSRDVRHAHPNRIVADAMTPDPLGIPANAFLWDALQTMEHNGIERLVVFQHEQAVGIVTRESIVTKLSEWKDPLTSLYRSPYMHLIGEQLIERGESFQLLFIDLNRFGDINKKYGHPAGDDMIREFSNMLKSLFDGEDYICRYGGDEFVVITQKEDETVQRFIARISKEIKAGPAMISAETGWLNARSEPEWFRLTFRDLIARASLLSTKAKQPSGAPS